MILTPLNLNEKLVINQNAKYLVHSASFSAREKREPAQLPPLGRKKLLQTLNKNLSENQKIKSLSDNRKTRNQKLERESEKGSVLNGLLINVSNCPTSEKTDAKQNKEKITKTEETLLKSKNTDKGPALFGECSVWTTWQKQRICCEKSQIFP